MTKLKIRASALTLLLLLAVAGVALSQDAESISVIGSAIVNPLVEALAEDNGRPVDIRTMGTAAGIDQFCNGAIDLATATRAISEAESVICAANEVDFSEFILGHRIVAFIAGVDVPLECLPEFQLDALLKPTASNAATDWTFYDPESELALTLILPRDDQIEYAIVDELVVGDGLRRDVQSYSDSAEAIGLVREAAGALAIVPWSEGLASAEGIKLLEFSGEEAVGCASPSAESVESDEYSAALSLRLYVNRARLDASQSLSELMQFMLDEANAPLIAARGITPATSAGYALNAAVLADAEAETQFDLSFDIFERLDELSGEITIVGAANSFAVLERVSEDLSVRSESFEVAFKLAGRDAGVASVCGNEADIAAVDAEVVLGAEAACEASDIVAHGLNLGAEATVLLANASDDYASCLSSAQIARLWSAESTESVTNWSQLDSSFPEQDLTLFGLRTLGTETDILLQGAGEVIPPIRRDTEKDFSPLYRAAAVANVPGALTYMAWADYQDVLENEQANIKLVAVDDGAGCIVPTTVTIEDGSYPLSRSASLLVGEASLADINVQAFLWQLFDEDNWFFVEDAGFIGVSRLDLPIIQRQLRQRFAAAVEKFPATEAGDEPGADEASGDAPSTDSASG